MSDTNNTPDHHGDEVDIHAEYPNETMQLLIERSSCRSFHDKKIPEDVMRLILEAGTHAATGGNLQPFSIIRIEDQATKDRLVKLNEGQTFIGTAPTNFLFCIDWYRLKRWAEIEKAPFAAHNAFRHFWISFQDTIIAAQNICTAADALGLGSVYIGTVMECFPELKEMFDLPDGVFPVVLLSLGYPKERPKPKRKLNIDVITHKEKYRRLTDEETLAAFNDKYTYRGVEPTEERLAVMEQVCRNVHGEEFAKECLALIRERGIINVAQRYFGLHYNADFMASHNPQFMQTMEDFGFGWFKEWKAME